MSFQIEYACICNNGKVRTHNEDNFWCEGTYLPAINNGTDEHLSGYTAENQSAVFAVFDGMGGESCGEMAAFVSAQCLDQLIRDNKNALGEDPEMFLEQSCKQMNEAVCSYARENKIRSMGSTVAMAAFHEKKVCISNLGDSRVYWYHDGELMQVSADHVMGKGLFGKPPLTQFLGIDESQMVLEPHIKSVEYSENDLFLLCSDGITDMLSETELCSMIAEASAKMYSVMDLAKKMVNRALEKGGRDNTTLILCRAQQRAKDSLWNRIIRRLRER